MIDFGLHLEVRDRRLGLGHAAGDDLLQAGQLLGPAGSATVRRGSGLR